MNDLVSIVIPVYKVEDYISNTIISIVNQTYTNIEVILVDDGSPDKSIAVAEGLLSKTQINWRVLHQENQGLSMARNNGIKESKGEWVICLDSDDYIEEHTIEVMLKNAINNKVLCSFCGFKSVKLDGIAEGVKNKRSAKFYVQEEILNLFLKRKIRLLVTGMLLNRSLYNGLVYDKNCPYDEDIHFLWRLLLKCDGIVYDGTDYYNYLSRGTSMVHSLSSEHYIKASNAYKEMVKLLPASNPIVPCILPKYHLGGLHVLAKSNSYSTFKKTALEDGYRIKITPLLIKGDLKLRLFSILYYLSLRLFYIICRKY